jgi:hypothetical protein
MITDAATGAQVNTTDATKRNGRLIDGKPVVDFTLAELGAKLKTATMLRNQCNRLIRELTAEQDRRIAELRAVKHLEVADAGDRYAVVNPRPAPSEHQQNVLDLFEKVLERDDQAMLDEVYALCHETFAHLTSWSSDFGEGVDAAYARRSAEIASALEDAG